MAILRGFPASNRVSTSLPFDEVDGDWVCIGECRVADNNDPMNSGRIKLGNGQWIYPRWGRTTGFYGIPSVNSLVKVWRKELGSSGQFCVYETITPNLTDDDITWESEGF